MNCRFCNSNLIVKAGFIRGAQRYKCKDCKSRDDRVGLQLIKLMALKLLKKGLSFRGNGRTLEEHLK